MIKKYLLIYLLSTLAYSFFDGSKFSSFNPELFIWGQPVFLILLLPPLILYEVLRRTLFAKRRNPLLVLIVLFLTYIFGVLIFYLLSLTRFTIHEGSFKSLLVTPILFCKIILFVSDRLSILIRRKQV